MLERIGKYEVRKEIGRGAFGTVYEGFDPAIGRRVAIKTLRTDVFDPSQLPEVLARFKREAQSAGRLAHPHIVTIYEYGEESGVPYIVMEFLSGTELGVLLSRGSRFPLDEIVRVMTQLLGALAVAHENGVVHRDLKPANIFLLQDGSLKVVDFGIAHVETSELTQTGALLGTPAYMSPEQVLGMPVNFRSDIFSAGGVLYQLLTGERPFTGAINTINQKILHQEPLEPSKLNPLLSAAWDTVVSRAMAKKPAARYESARHFAEAIKIAFQAENAHEEELRRKAAEASEHAYREAEERSRVEARRRVEAERVAKEEAEARRAAKQAARRYAAEDQARAEAARRKAEETVAMPEPRSRKAIYVVPVGKPLKHLPGEG